MWIKHIFSRSDSYGKKNVRRKTSVTTGGNDVRPGRNESGDFDASGFVKTRVNF